MPTEAEVVSKYTGDGPVVSGEKVPVPKMEVVIDAIEDNPDKTVTVHLAVEKLSVSVETPFKEMPYSSPNKIWSSMSVRPTGNWHIQVRLDSREVAEGPRGPIKVLEEMIKLNLDMQRLQIVVKQSNVKVPGEDVKINR